MRVFIFDDHPPEDTDLQCDKCKKTFTATAETQQSGTTKTDIKGVGVSSHFNVCPHCGHKCYG